jgi:UDP-N-acetylglucosamine 1-carboxyvinyltransferase
MKQLLITGGAPCRGEVTISGAKNAATKMMIASLLTGEAVTLTNIPKHDDTLITQEICEKVGARSVWNDHTLTLQTTKMESSALMTLSRKNRLSILALIPLLHRTGEAVIPMVEGDHIGPRPVNWHVRALQTLGAEVVERQGAVEAKVSGRLKGNLIKLPYPSVGATETSILAAVLAEGRTVIRNAAIEPEIMELIKMLQTMGAVIGVGAGRLIEIYGVESLHGTTFRVMPDPLEAVSFACVALGTHGEIFVKDAVHNHLITFLNTVRRIGGDYEVKPDGIIFRAQNGFKGIELETDTFPGFRTDWQQPTVVLLTQATGTSVVHETVYEDRFGYTNALQKMGADVTVFSNCLGEISCRFQGKNYRHSAVINGPRHLTAAHLTISDIRAGLALVVAALIADGTSVLTGVEHLERGYERLEEKLKSVGAKIEMQEIPTP